MSARRTGTAFGILLWCSAASLAYAADAPPPASDAAAPANAEPIVNEQTIAKVIPGQSTSAQVQTLLGTPWRATQLDDCGAETWEYRGSDADGAYTVHIEFDDHHVTSVVAKVTEKGPAVKRAVARAVPTKDDDCVP